MRNNRLIGLLLVILVGIGAFVLVYTVYSVVTRAESARVVHDPHEKKMVITAAADIAPGTTIVSESLRQRELPENFIPDDVYRTPEEVVGRVASERILAGEFIREERLAAQDAGVGLAAIIPRGMRALQVPIRDGAAVSGFINPGNFVDVIAVCAHAEPPEVRTLLHAITVLAVDDRMVARLSAEEQQERSKRHRTTGLEPSVTLALSPADAELVKHAFGTCSITLTLRNDIDVTQITTNGPQATTTTPATPSPTPAP